MKTRNYLARVSWMFAPALFALSLFALSGQSDQTTPTILRGEVTDTICAKSGSHEEMMAKIPSMACPERRAVLAGESPVRVSAGAPGSRLQPGGEIQPSQAECRKPLQQRGA